MRTQAFSAHPTTQGCPTETPLQSPQSTLPAESNEVPPRPLGLEEVQEVRTLGESSAPSLRSVTLGKVYNFSGPQFLYL